MSKWFHHMREFYTLYAFITTNDLKWAKNGATLQLVESGKHNKCCKRHLIGGHFSSFSERKRADFCIGSNCSNQR